MSYKAIPAVVYTNPELASVGKTEEELVANGESFRVQKIPMTYSGRFVAENENGNGLCKLITDDEDRIIGCHLLGNPAPRLSSPPESLSRMVIQSMNLRKIFSRIRQSVRSSTKVYISNKTPN